MILTIIVFILILGILVFAHELGHFVSAKLFGVKVEEFGFGFPPRIFGFKKGETTYSLNAIPIGGFVKIFGEEREDNKSQSKRAFYNKPIWQRAIILVMGVIMNLFVAGIFLSIVYGIGIPSMVENGQETNYKDIKIQIVGLAKDSPAEKAGLKVGDSIVGLSFKDEQIEIKEIENVQMFVVMHVGEEIVFKIKRGNDIFEKNILSRISSPEGEGATGIIMTKTGLLSYPWYRAIIMGFALVGKLTITIISTLFLLIKTLILKGTMIGEVAGPIGVAVLTSQVVQLGWNYVLQFAAFLSINLAIINILPFPALDGGRLLFLLIEKIKGKPVNFKIERFVHALGFVILIGLMLIVTLRDIIKLF